MPTGIITEFARHSDFEVPALLTRRQPILIAGVDLRGKNFVEPSSTVAIARSGLTVETSHALAPDQEVTVSDGNREVRCRVAGKISSNPQNSIYGLCFLSKAANFWSIALPGHERRAVLECVRCNTRHRYSLNEVESAVLEETGKVGLACSKCNDGTLWKFADGTNFLDEQAADSPNGVSDLEIVRDNLYITLADSIGAVAAPRPRDINERDHKRLGLTRAKACIQQLDTGDQEVVELINVSKGGACFLSQSLYSLGAWIKIAAPYTPNASNIFVSARIVRAVKKDWTCEYGVQISRSSLK
jgi:hypothetical protein